MSFQSVDALALAVIIVATVLIMVVANSLLNLNKVNAYKAKLYDKEMERQENQEVIEGLEKDLVTHKHRLAVSLKNNQKYSGCIEKLRKKLSEISTSFNLLDKHHKILKMSYSNIQKQKRSLELELANANDRCKQVQAVVKHYRTRYPAPKKEVQEVSNA